jgi:Domain of unknown function (DUF6794)
MFWLGIISFEGVAQGFGETETELDSIYEQRILMEEIEGVYIPVDLEDAFVELERLSSAADIDKYRKATEETVRDKLHFGLGRWMMYNWGFYMGSRLSHYLKNLGLEHPDDMAKFLLVSWHRHLNEKPLEIEEQVVYYYEKREQARRERAQSNEVIHEETRKRKN